MSNFYIEDENGDIKPTYDLMKWGRWFEAADRHVALTEVGGGKVSTVFLGLDHRFFGDGPPLLWETMVFGGPLDGRCERYCTRVEALAGHEEVVRDVRDWTGFLVAVGDYDEEGWVVE